MVSIQDIIKAKRDRYKYFTVEESLAAVKNNSHSLPFVKSQTEAICLAAVKSDGYSLEFVKDQTEAICLAAVKNQPYSLRYVKDQTEEICLAAVNSDGDSLRFVNETLFQSDDEDVIELTDAEISDRLGYKVRSIKG